MTISLQRETESCVTLQWAGRNTQIFTAGIDFSAVSLVQTEQFDLSYILGALRECLA